MTAQPGLWGPVNWAFLDPARRVALGCRAITMGSFQVVML